MKHLKYDMYEAVGNGHPQNVMKELGITYKLSVPQSMGDCWWFFCCEGYGEKLPVFLTEMCEDNDFEKYIGFGLSYEKVEMLQEYIILHP